MSYIATFTIPPETLPFGETLVENPRVRIQVERIIPTDEAALPFFWVWGGDPELFLEAAEDEAEIANTRLLAHVDNGALFRAEWSPNAELIDGLKDLSATIVESEGTAERWRFEVRAQDRETFPEFQAVFQEQGIPISLQQLHDLADAVDDGRGELTPEQRETMITAYREGYFENPREVTQAELGEQFDISHRAVSERLRRGTRNLVSATLLPADDVA